MAAAGVEIYVKCVQGMLVMEKIDRPTFSRLTSEPNNWLQIAWRTVTALRWAIQVTVAIFAGCIAASLASSDGSVVAAAAAEVMALVQAQVAAAKARTLSAEPFSGLPSSPLMNIMFFLHPPELGMMAQTCKKVHTMVSRLRSRLFRVHAYRLLFDRDVEDLKASPAAASIAAAASSAGDGGALEAAAKTEILAAAVAHRVAAGLPMSPALASAAAASAAAAAGPAHAAVHGDIDDDDDDDDDGGVPHWLPAPAQDVGAAAGAGTAGLKLEEPLLEAIHGRRGKAVLDRVPWWAMQGPVILPSMLSAFVRVFGPFADTPEQSAAKRPALHWAAARASEDEAWRSLVEAYASQNGVSLRRNVLLEVRRAAAALEEVDHAAPSRSTAAEAAASAAASMSSTSPSSSSAAAGVDQSLVDAEAKFAATIFGMRPSEPFPATTTTPPMDPFAWWRANKDASVQGRRRSLAALDAIQRLALPLDSGCWLRLSSYVVPNVHAEEQSRRTGTTGSMPGLGGTHSFIQGSSGAVESDAHAGAAASRTKQLPLQLDLRRSEVAGDRSQWLRVPFAPQIDTIFAWDRPPHSSNIVIKLASSTLNDSGVGAVDICRCTLRIGMSGHARRGLEDRVRQAEGKSAFREVIRSGGSETDALAAAQEAVEAASFTYTPPGWSGSSPIDADLGMVSFSPHGARVAVEMGLLGADLTRTAGMLLEGNALAFFGAGGMEITHNVAPSANAARGPEMISSAKLNNNGIGEVRRGIVDLPIAALWWKVRLGFEQECDRIVIDALASRQ